MISLPYRYCSHIYNIFILSSLFLLSFLCISCHADSNDQFGGIILPIYPGSYSIKQGYDSKIKCKYAIYKIKADFPAAEVVKYLENASRDMNLDYYRGDGSGSMQWESFNYATGNWEKADGIPARYTGTWMDEKREKLFLLLMSYKYDGSNDEWKNTLNVDCKVCQYFPEYERSEPPEEVKQKVKPQFFGLNPDFPTSQL